MEQVVTNAVVTSPAGAASICARCRLRVLTRGLAAWARSGAHCEYGAVPTPPTDQVAAWCARWLGSPPATVLFTTGHLSSVTGLRLVDGREVVVKVRPYASRLAGCAAVHRALWSAGFACPEPLVDLRQLNGYAISAEAAVPDTDEPPPDSELATLSAAALAHLVDLAPDATDLKPSPSWLGWDHDEPGLWPTPEGRDVDLNAYAEPSWLDRVAGAVRDRLREHAGNAVVGHGDWHPENLRWKGRELVAVHDWDSVIRQPEAAIAGFAAVSFRGLAGPAAHADIAAFLDAYQLARGRPWSAEEYAICWAAGLWQRAVDAKVQSLQGDPEEVLTRDQARTRLSLAGLDPDLVAHSPR
jgi:Ser/Thr protein kinase RdoA (MazF antagonist)